jgi:hypothetical protein
MSCDLRKTILWVSLFAIAMGFMESSVVIYLRELYYQSGFEFPLKPIPPFIARVEFFRELATIFMLIGCGIIAGKCKLSRFAYFIYAFAVWDICYYLFLYVCLGWPASLSTWDILFLIPVPWVGPVWAPCLLSLLMIVGSAFVILRLERDRFFRVSPSQWWLVIAGSFTCIVSFMWDYLSTRSGETWSVFSSSQLFGDISTYVPQRFNYALFFTGFLFMSLPLFYLMFKTKNR